MSSNKRSRTAIRKSFLRFADRNYKSDDKSDDNVQDTDKDLSPQLESLRAENAAMLVAGRELAGENSVMRSAGMRLETEVRDLTAKLSELDDLDTKNRSLRSEVQELKTRLNRCPDPDVVKKLRDQVADLTQDNASLRNQVSELARKLKALEPVSGYVCRRPYDSGNATMKERVSACEKTEGAPSSFDDVRKVPGGRFKQKQTCTENCFFG